MEMKTRQQQVEKQRQYIEDHKGCNHIIQCAITEEDRERAVELMRSGVHPDAMLGAAMLSGPCTVRGE